MTGRRAIVGLCMLCALLVSAFAAQGASATTKGTTAFTCVKDAENGDKFGAHCLDSGTEKFKHVAIAANTTTSITGTNANTLNETKASEESVLKATIAGTPLELKATGLGGEGWLTNATTASGEHYVHGEGTITYTGVTVTKPAGKGCKVWTDNAGAEGEEGVVHTNPLKATTEGQGDFVKFEPKEGNIFATFFITCNKGEVPETLEGTWTVNGSVKCPINGATIKCAHAAVTTQATLKTKGVNAGIEGSLTLKGRHPGIDPEGTYNPITATTIETP